MGKLHTLVATTCILLCLGIHAHAENMSVGVGAAGNFYLVDGTPALGSGVGGGIYFDYRWAPQLSTQLSAFVTTQSGKDGHAGDDDILFLAIPSIDFKYYFLNDGGRIDPYGLLGIGFYMNSEGTQQNGTLAMGIGANLGVGSDFYLTPAISAYTNLVFRSIGMITSASGANNGDGMFPLTASGGVAFHF